MNVKCLICSDLFTPSSDIYGTPCGHLFHYHCLGQWIERSRTCPQCRSKTTEKTIHKVYLSVEENAETTDFSTLQNKFDNLQFQMNLKEKDVKIANEKYQKVKKQIIGLREEIKSQEDRARVLESAVHAMKDQVVYFKSKAKECDKMEEEVKRLKDNLKNMEQVQLVISGNCEQVNDMLRHNRDPESLTLLVATLKKELIDSDKRKKQITARLKEVQNETQKYKLELAQLNKHNNKLQQDLESHKHCEAERHYLKSKISELSTKGSEVDSPKLTNTSVGRIINESPVPLQKVMPLKVDEAACKDKSPSVQEKVEAIKESDSPYLRVQSSSLGISGLMNYSNKFQQRPKSTSSMSNKFSIFKQPSLKAENIHRPGLQVSYDGLGGHAKDDQFPVPKPINVSLKRSKSSTVTSAKFRKLAPGPQKKLNDFFPDSQSDQD